MKKSVAMVEDDQQLREHLARILLKAPDISFVGAYSSAEEALPQITKERPDVVLMDIKLPGISGIECVAEIKRLLPGTLVIMVTIYEENERIFQALKAGANGYIIKSDSPEQLVEAIRDVSHGGGPMSASIARKVIQHFHATEESIPQADNLSPREREVLELLGQGFIYKEIADRLKIAVTTVRTYVENICQKMHVRSRLEAIAKHRAQK